MTLLASCSEPFEPAWRVDSYRLLAVRSDPASLQPGESARLDVLDYASPERDVAYEWEWCPLPTSSQSEYVCPLDRVREQIDDRDEAPSIPDELFSLGSGPTARLPYPGGRQQVEQLCNRLQSALADVDANGPLSGLVPSTDCDRSYDVSVRVTARPEGGDEVVARKTVTLATGADSGELNSNPGHEGIDIRLADRSKAKRVRDELNWVAEEGVSGEDRWHPVSPNETTHLLAGLRYQVRADVEPGSLETWRPPAPVGSERERLPSEPETWIFEWFTSDGRLTRNEQIFSRRDAIPVDKAARTALTVPGGLGKGCPAATQSLERRLHADTGPHDTGADAVDDVDDDGSDAGRPDGSNDDGSRGRDAATLDVTGDASRARDVAPPSDTSETIDTSRDTVPDHGGGRDGSSRGDTASMPPDVADATAPTIDPACRLVVWSIIRDERLGVDWAERRFRIVGRLK